MNKRIYKKFSRRKMHRHYADLRKGAIYKVFEIARTYTMHTWRLFPKMIICSENRERK